MIVELPPGNHYRPLTPPWERIALELAGCVKAAEAHPSHGDGVSARREMNDALRIYRVLSAAYAVVETAAT
jgi:hypothetical protein